MTNTPFFEARLLDGDILAVVLRGNLDSASTPEFDQLIRQHLDAGRTRIIIDCRYLGFISSLGIGSLVALQTRLRRQGGAVKLAAIQGPVIDVLKAVRLDKVFDHYGDLEFARKSFDASGA